MIPTEIKLLILELLSFEKAIFFDQNTAFLSLISSHDRKIAFKIITDNIDFLKSLSSQRLFNDNEASNKMLVRCIRKRDIEFIKKFHSKEILDKMKNVMIRKMGEKYQVFLKKLVEETKKDQLIIDRYSIPKKANPLNKVNLNNECEKKRFAICIKKRFECSLENSIEIQDDDVVNANLIDEACKIGSFEIVKFLHSVGRKCSRSSLRYASGSGNIKIVEFLFSLGIRCFIHSLNEASIHGHVEVVKFLFNNGAKFTKFALSKAIKNKQYKVVDYLQSVTSFNSTSKYQSEMYYDYSSSECSSDCDTSGFYNY